MTNQARSASKNIRIQVFKCAIERIIDRKNNTKIPLSTLYEKNRIDLYDELNI